MDMQSPASASDGEGLAARPVSAPAGRVSTSRKQPAPIDESLDDSGKRNGQRKSVNEGLWGWDRVLRRVVRKRMGTELTSRAVNVAIRNMERNTTRADPCKKIVGQVLDALIADGACRRRAFGVR